MAAPSETQAGFGEPLLSSRARASASIREYNAKSAEEDGDKNQLWMSAASLIPNISIRYTRSQGPIEKFEWDMHDLWHLYYHASMNTSDQLPEQDRLVGQILQAKELGVLTRKDESLGVIEEAVTSAGKVWEDLPFLVEDMMGYWTRDCGNMTTIERKNFASFLAKLSAAGVADDKLCGCALAVLRDTLETTRPITNTALSETNEDQDDEYERHNPEILTVADLLPAANMWIFKAGAKLIELSQKSAIFFPHDVGTLGDLARAEGIVQEHGGFSPQRWLFWVKRIGELEDQAMGLDGELATLAHRVRNNLVTAACESDTEMSRELARHGQLPY